MKVTVNSGTTTGVKVNTSGTSQVVSVGIQGPAGPQASISTLPDVDVSELNNGSVLVYSQQNQKWKSTTTLDAQNMEGGEF